MINMTNVHFAFSKLAMSTTQEKGLSADQLHASSARQPAKVDRFLFLETHSYSNYSYVITLISQQ